MRNSSISLKRVLSRSLVRARAHMHKQARTPKCIHHRKHIRPDAWVLFILSKTGEYVNVFTFG
jgi:hypothetical protein